MSAKDDIAALEKGLEFFNQLKQKDAATNNIPHIVDTGASVMNNKPVAWMSPDGKVSDTEGKLFYIPLYTHPVKELTDEEILEICDLGEWHKDEFAINFARAILRKTQEK